MNTWGIIVDDQMINVKPLDYSTTDVNNRGNICAMIMDIPVKIDEADFTHILSATDVRYWYRVTKRNRRNVYKMVVLFNSTSERKHAIDNYQIKIDRNIYTWFF